MAGRPKWIPDELICRKAQEMASKGLTVLQIADCLGVSDATVYERQKEYPEFLESIKRGRSLGIQQVANALFDKAIDGDNTCMIFYLKSRDRESWGDQYIEPIQEIPPINITIDSSAVN
jgi:predicted transcriptional regulator|tara:strand:+ start:224 stop:580 length:357 start_codon:yes stop_codon:yes gene_type:complete